jgi:CubicO group peptidase (beta-lactamase class C family)
MEKQIKEILLRGVLNKAFPGGQYGILENGVITTGHFGYKEILDEQIETTGSEVYDIASLSKVVSTTILIFKLIETGKLKLDTQIHDYLPVAFKGITVYDLLTHTSGLDADIKKANLLESREELLEKLFQSQPDQSKKGTIVYSDIGFMLLGLLIEKISGKTLDVYAKEVIFNPLNMRNTSYHPNIHDAAPTEYRTSPVFTGLLRGKVHDEKSFALNGVSGHAGVFSTAYDLSLFMKALVEDRFVLNKETVELMSLSQIEGLNQFGVLKHRALGYEKPTKESVFKAYRMAMITHTGFTGCHLIINKEKKFGFVLLTNAVHPKRENNQIFSYRDEISNVILEKWEETK